jgi:hypothetical protein
MVSQNLKIQKLIDTSSELGYYSQYTVRLLTVRTVIDPRQMQRIFSSILCVQTSSEAHPASYPVRTGGLSLG